MKPLSIYIHIPFCIKKCPYCDFFSRKYSIEKSEEYISFLCNQIKDNSYKYNNRVIDTIYFGGGTPSIIGTDNIIKILNCIYNNYTVSNPEITIEVNPTSTLNLDFTLLHTSGVNRISLGMQSSNDLELEILGRGHTKFDIINCVDKIKKSGITNISLDVMIGISKQTKESLQDTLYFCKSLDVPHISAYILKIEEKTKYNKIRDTLNLPDEDTVSDLYLFMITYLKTLGYNQYEISNFCKPNFESKHNLKYWLCEEYLGFGVASHSYVDNKRFYSPSNFSDYYNNIIIDDGNGGSEEEYIMMNLRLTKGISFVKFKERFNCSFPEKYIKNANKPKFTSFVCNDNDRLYLTEKGFLISNYIISSILFDD